jgi:hypothetical protein
MKEYICDRCGTMSDKESDFMLGKGVNVHLMATGDYCLPCFEQVKKAADIFLIRMEELKGFFTYKARRHFCKDMEVNRSMQRVDDIKKLEVDYDRIFFDAQ